MLDGQLGVAPPGKLQKCHWQRKLALELGPLAVEQHRAKASGHQAEGALPGIVVAPRTVAENTVDVAAVADAAETALAAVEVLDGDALEGLACAVGAACMLPAAEHMEEFLVSAVGISVRFEPVQETKSLHWEPTCDATAAPLDTCCPCGHDGRPLDLDRDKDRQTLAGYDVDAPGQADEMVRSSVLVETKMLRTTLVPGGHQCRNPSACPHLDLGVQSRLQHHRHTRNNRQPSGRTDQNQPMWVSGPDTCLISLEPALLLLRAHQAAESKQRVQYHEDRRTMSI